MGSSKLTTDIEKKPPSYNFTLKIRNNIPNAITSLRLMALPLLAYSFSHQVVFATYVLFLFSISTDLLDGFIARKLGSTSKLGTYFDVTFDFIFILGMYLTFVNKGIYSPWILLLIILVFAQFTFSNLYSKQTIYDPIGKYYGSLLFGGIGLTLLFLDKFIYDIVTSGIIISTILSLISRLTYFFKKMGILG